MRKFSVRWWVEDPRARFDAAIAALTGEYGDATTVGWTPRAIDSWFARLRYPLTMGTTGRNPS